MLTGTEVKSLRTGRSTIAESYASVDRNGEIWLINANIPEYHSGNRFNHEPKRQRKLLLKTGDRQTVARRAARGHDHRAAETLFQRQGPRKMEIALARENKVHDKRETEKQRDWNREKSRLLKQRD